MTKTVKIIWTTAALLGAVSLFFNFREIPQETPPPLKNGEFLCPPDKQAEAAYRHFLESRGRKA